MGALLSGQASAATAPQALAPQQQCSQNKPRTRSLANLWQIESGLVLCSAVFYANPATNGLRVLSQAVSEILLIQITRRESKHHFDSLWLGQGKFDAVKPQKHIGADKCSALVAVVEWMIFGDSVGVGGGKGRRVTLFVVK
jgi:hypothetical protein